MNKRSAESLFSRKNALSDICVGPTVRNAQWDHYINLCAVTSLYIRIYFYLKSTSYRSMITSMNSLLQESNVTVWQPGKATICLLLILPTPPSEGNRSLTWTYALRIRAFHWDRFWVAYTRLLCEWSLFGAKGLWNIIVISDARQSNYSHGGETGGTVPQNLRWGTAHASVSPIFWKLLVLDVRQSTNWVKKGLQEGC